VDKGKGRIFINSAGIGVVLPQVRISHARSVWDAVL
jgi:hypothetical protein